MSKAQPVPDKRRRNQARSLRQSYQNLTLGLVGLLVALLAVYCTNSAAISPTQDKPAAPAQLPTTQPVAAAITSTVTATTSTFIPLIAVDSGTSVPTATAIAPSTTPTPTSPVTPAIPLYTYEVINVYPHDPQAFTQGLVFDGTTLYEGTGLNGRSSVRRVDLETGQVLQQIDLAAEYFGEGITIFGERIYQLTWRSGLGFVYDQASFTLQQQFTYSTEGWGITHDGEQLIMSDGSERLYFWNPATLEQTGFITVADNNGAVVRLNELEYIEGEVYANIWLTDHIARIDPTTGRVTGWIDLAGLLTAEERGSADVLNGIAYMPESDRLFVTGKLWPKLFEIRLILQP